MKTLSPTETAIRDAVVAHYLETCKPADAKDLAARLGWSVGKVRRIIADECHGAASGTHAEQDHRASHSRNYPSMGPVGAHRVWVYYPSLAHLRDIILAHAPMPCESCGQRECVCNEAATA